MSSTPAEMARQIFTRGWGEGDFSGLESALEGPFTFHVRGMPREMGLDDLRQIVAGWRTGFPDLRFEIDDLVAAGGVVAVRARLVGTHRGEWRDLGPTGNRIDVEHMFFLRFEAERLVEVFELLDQDALRRQMQA